MIQRSRSLIVPPASAPLGRPEAPSAPWFAAAGPAGRLISGPSNCASCSAVRPDVGGAIARRRPLAGPSLGSEEAIRVSPSPRPLPPVTGRGPLLGSPVRVLILKVGCTAEPHR